jgi:sulfate permease, SulP family
MPLNLFSGLRPLDRRQALRDCLAGVNLASINLPQVLGYARIAGMPVVTGVYTLLLPLVGFAVFGSSRHLGVAADSAASIVLARICSTRTKIVSWTKCARRSRVRPLRCIP